jgi:thioester reductase-like protein
VFTTLAAKKIDLPEHGIKIVCFPSDLSRDDLGLDKSTLHLLRKSLTTVIHCAWAVNFNLGVQSFEKQHIKGTYNLLNICLSTTTPSPAKLFFCSSISAAAGTPLPAVIQETYISDLSHAQNMGYARSKLITETIIKAAVEQTGMVAKVLRVGQIVGDTQNGMWNSTEAISLMIRSATTIGALPALEEVSIHCYRHSSTFTHFFRHHLGCLWMSSHTPSLSLPKSTSAHQALQDFQLKLKTHQ